MCLIVFALDVHSEYRLTLAANRDEFFNRPTAALAEWDDHPGVFGGRDLQAGGSWFCATESGRWAAVTNFRDAAEFTRQPIRSRGHLVSGFVTSSLTPREYLAEIVPIMHDFNGYNLLVGDADTVFWMSNRGPEPGAYRSLGPGIYGISNHLLDTPWPKVERGKRALDALLADGGSPEPGELLDLLLDRTYAADHELPDTGVPRELERALSAPFITTPGYGTRSSTALIIERNGRIHLAERRYDEEGRPRGETILLL